jgi:hypothetical protein
MKYILSLLLVLCTGLSLFSQHTYKGTVVDEETLQPLTGVNVFLLENQQTGTNTDDKGRFSITIALEEADFVFTYLGYEGDTLRLSPNASYSDTIFLKSDIFQLPDVEITAQMQIIPVTRPKHSVLDFSIWNDYVVYVRYIGQKKALVLADLNGNPIFSKPIDLKGVEKLHRSCLGNLHLITGTKGVEMFIEQDTIRMGKVYDRKFYELYLEPCVAGLDDEIILRKEEDLGLRTSFEKAYKDASGSELIYRVIDEDKLRTYYEKYSLVNSAGNNSIAMLEVQYGDFKRAQRAEFERDFYRKIFLKGIEIPLVKMRDQLAIFDFVNGWMVFTDYDGNIMGKQDIDFHLNPDWAKTVIIDDIEQRIFTTFKKGTGKFITEIDLNTGKCKKPLHLDSKLVKKIDIHNGQMYLLQSEAHLSYWTLNKVRL